MDATLMAARPIAVRRGAAWHGPAGLLLALLLVVSAAPAHAVELVLEAVTATTGSGEVKLRVNSRATFDFDPATGQLVSSGSWLAEYLLPNQVVRFAHQVEDLTASADGPLAVKSYQCIEGTFGGQFLAANLCGNYRFGPNGIDEGGAVDDVVVGPPRSLAGYQVGGFDWDGEVLEVVLTAGPAEGGELFRESGLRLRLVAKRAR